MERLEEAGLMADLRSITGTPLPDWETVLEEGEAVRAAIARGEVAWPPKPGTTHHALLRGIGRLEQLPALFDPDHFVCFVGTPTVAGILERLREGMARVGASAQQSWTTLSTTAHELYQLLRWEHYGRRVYVVEEGTFDLLAHTALPDVPIGHLEAPLPTFYVRLPDGAFHFDVAMDPEPQPAEGVMVSFDTASAKPDRPREVSYLITGRSPRGPDDDNVAYVAAAIRPEMPISDLEIPSGEAVRSTGEEALGVLIPRAVVALCLYLQSEHPALEPVPPPEKKDPARVQNPGKRRKLKQRNARITDLGYVRVGTPEEGPQPSHAESGGRGRKLDHQVWVEGHWRWQAHGPRHSKRKLIWIRPHMRGPDLAESEQIRAKRVPGAKRKYPSR